MVFEEKTINAANYKAQRIRWFGEQYYNALFHFKTLMIGTIRNLNFNCLDYWLTVIRPPRSIQLVVAGLLFGYDLLDLSPSIASIPFILNFTSFVIVAMPLLKGKNLLSFLLNSFRVLFGNITSSLQCLKTKYLGTFVHTR